MFASLLSSLASTGITIAASFLPIPSTFSSSDADLDAHLARRRSSSRTRATRTVADNFFAPPPCSSSSITSRSPLSSTSSYPFAQPSPASIETLAALKAWAADNLVDLEHSEHDEPLDDDDDDAASLASYDCTSSDDDSESTFEQVCPSADDEDEERFDPREMIERPDSPMARNLMRLDDDSDDDDDDFPVPTFLPSAFSSSSTPSLTSDSDSNSEDFDSEDEYDERFVHLPSLRRTFTRNSKAEHAIDSAIDYQKKALFVSAFRQGLIVIEA
ncbi:putative glucan 4-alpha-glucosidase protein [Pseudohyphozyma bogoriensis]|nr:putative glucan 4-alpha-glucosidase protein [Pseudohyphozyma bogoriensis]